MQFLLAHGLPPRKSEHRRESRARGVPPLVEVLREDGGHKGIVQTLRRPRPGLLVDLHHRQLAELLDVWHSRRGGFFCARTSLDARPRGLDFLEPVLQGVFAFPTHRALLVLCDLLPDAVLYSLKVCIGREVR